MKTATATIDDGGKMPSARAAEPLNQAAKFVFVRVLFALSDFVAFDNGKEVLCYAVRATGKASRLER